MSRRSGTSWLWVASAVMAAATIAVWTQVRSVGAHDTSFQVHWLVLAALFAVAEMHVFHVQLRRETQTFSLNEIPIILGLFFATPSELLIAQAVGVAAALAFYRRQPLLKLVFNVSQFTFSTVIAIAVFQTVGVTAGLLGSSEILASFLAAAAAIVAGTAAVIVAISLTEGAPSFRQMLRNLGFGFAGTAANTGLALLGVVLLRVDPTSAWLLALPLALLFIAYRGYTTHRLQNERLSALAESTRDVERSVSLEPAMTGVLRSAREMLKAEVAIIRFFGEGPGDLTLEVLLDERQDEAQLSYVELDPNLGVWRQVASAGEGVLLSRPIADPVLREHFASRGMRDAVVVPLFGREGVTGTMTVGNRRGDVETFNRGSLQLLETFANQVGTALENVRLLSKLQLVVSDLTEAGHRKDEMLANVAHDMRNPLTSLMAFIHLLIDDAEITDDERRSYLETMAMQGEQLRALVDDLVRRAATQDRAPGYSSVRVDVHALIKRTLASFASADRRFEVTVERSLPQLFSNPGAIGRILANLVSNAVRCSEPGSVVHIKALADGDRGVTFSVIDHGIGIDPSLHGRIFERFFQAGTSGSAGLGLAIANELTQDLQGRLWLESSAPGQGSEFRLSVPSSVSQSVPDSPVSGRRQSSV